MRDLTDISDIRELLSETGFRFSKSMGQNFMAAPWVPERMAAAAGIDSGTGVLEIGPGVGALTVRLAERAAKVLALELDGALAPVLAKTLGGLPNVEVVFGDALKADFPALVGERFAGLRPLVCANIPYNVTTPLLTALIGPRCFESVTLMIQREVAERMTAAPGSEAYGAFSIFIQWHSEISLLFDVPPNCFVPRPKVTSSVVRLDTRKTPPAYVKNEKLFFRAVRAAFNQRRKTLANALSNGLPMPKAEAEALIASCGLPPSVRGETLGIEEFARIVNAL